MGIAISSLALHIPKGEGFCGKVREWQIEKGSVYRNQDAIHEIWLYKYGRKKWELETQACVAWLLLKGQTTEHCGTLLESIERKTESLRAVISIGLA